MHPFAKFKGHEHARLKAKHRAEGGGVDPSGGGPIRPGSNTKPMQDIPGGAPGTYYGTSPEPGPVGYKIQGPVAQQKGNNKIYAPTPEGRKAVTRTMDKYDNEYGAYRHRRRPVEGGME